MSPWPFVVLGLLGSLHCAGMCGGFALSVAAARPAGRGRALGDLVSYVLGKALTYAVLGLVAAHAGQALLAGGARLAGHEPVGEHLAAARRVLAWSVGAALALAGLAAWGVLPRPRRLGAGGRLAVGLARLRSGVGALPPSSRALGVGLVTGLLPCGLSWSALLLAVAAGPAAGAAGMFAFGLATVPVLAAVGLGWSRLSPRVRAVGARLAGPALIALGALTALRGGVPLPGDVVASPPCCAAEGVR